MNGTTLIVYTSKNEVFITTPEQEAKFLLHFHQWGNILDDFDRDERDITKEGGCVLVTSQTHVE